MNQIRIGLEVHVQLSLSGKLFSPAHAHRPDVDSVCWGLPGALPQLNPEAVTGALRLAVALSCRIASVLRFDRKHYTYPDLPKGYQITQERPLAWDGGLDVQQEGDAVRRIPIQRLHLEEDAGRIERGPDGLWVDLSRAGVGLVELVTPPVLRSGDEASRFMKALQLLLRTLAVSDASPEQGNLRADANISIRRPDGTWGPRVEIKNVSGFEGLAQAIEAEEIRQVFTVVERPQTLRYDRQTKELTVQRDKESTADYRFLPEPDLPPVHIPLELLNRLRAQLPEAPSDRRARWTSAGVARDVAEQLTADPMASELLDAILDQGTAAAPAAEFVRSILSPRLKNAPEVLGPLQGRPDLLADLVTWRAEGRLSSTRQKALLDDWLKLGKDPFEALAEQPEVTDAELKNWCLEVLHSHPLEVEKLRRGKQGVLGFFVGQIMKRSRGQADPQKVGRIFESLLRGGRVNGSSMNR